MTNKQRTKNDLETEDRRAMEDKTMRDNRIRNDYLTTEKRLRADKTMNEKRMRNDEITINRREVNDRNPSRDVALVILLLIVVTLGGYLFFR